MKKIIAISAAMLLAAFLFTGCSCAAEKITEKIIESAAASEGQDIDVDLSSGEVNITGEDGEQFSISSDDEGATITTEDGETTISSGENLSIPDDFPSQIPVPSDLNIITSATGQEGGQQQFSILGQYQGGSGTELFEWYKQEMSGWNITSQQTYEDEEGTTSTIIADNDNYNVNVFIMDSDGEVHLSLQATEK